MVNYLSFGAESRIGLSNNSILFNLIIAFDR